LNNSAKFTPERGTVELDLTRAGEFAVFRVRDNGIGIPSEKMSTIFDLFTQGDQSLDRLHGGLGVGLALVRRLVEKQGGTGTTCSEGAGRGSEFVIRLPALPHAVPGTSINHISNAPVDEAARRRVLVVDDFPGAAESLMKMLELNGHDARIARD